jgi:hypothetical protein
VTLNSLQRRTRDRGIAAVLALAALGVGWAIYLTSDARATSLHVGSPVPAPAAMTEVPESLDVRWTLGTDERFPAVVSPYGTVVTANGSTVTGSDPVTGTERWSYTRSNLPLCVVASGDREAVGLSVSGAVRGVLTGFVKSGRCSELTLLDPINGARRYQRTGFTGAESTAVFGGPYAGLVSSNLVELWRFDLVRTIQYGEQPQPTKPRTVHAGCAFTDAVVAATQFATVEHCPAGSDSTTLVVNYVDPGATTDGKEKKWDAFSFAPRATVDLKSDHARLLWGSADRSLVLVEDPEPAAVEFDSTGSEVSRVPVAVTPEEIEAADESGVTRATVGEDARYALVHHTLVAIADDGPEVRWTMPDVLGLPAIVGSQLLVPVTEGLAVVDADSGSSDRTLQLDRDGYEGSVDVGVVGNSVVETRGSLVVGLRSPDAPETDPAATSTSSSAPPTFFERPTTKGTSSSGSVSATK